jgi:FlaG/FlaF family flagellin (archaellin)
MPRIATSCLRALAVAAVMAFVVVAQASLSVPVAEAGKSKPDRMSPTVNVAAPSVGASVSGSVSIKGSAGDNVAVARVDVSVDGAPFAPASGTSAWALPLDTTSYGNGSHSVTARAVDTSGNSSLSSVSFMVSNVSPPPDTAPPTIGVTRPASGAVVDRQLQVEGVASDETGLASIEVRLDDGAFRPAAGTASWSATLDASGVQDGQHVVTARATDKAGNTSSTTVAVLISDQAVTAPPLAGGTIGGHVFQESDRDGVFETTEQPLSGAYVYLFNSSGGYLGNALTDATGWYRFTGLPDGGYSIELAPTSWNPLKGDWVPDTTGTIFPRRAVSLAGSVRADFGTRRIVRSSDAAAPISSYVGEGGLTVKSYDDAVSAKQIHDRLTSGALVGVESKDVTIRFDFAQTGRTYSMATKLNGVYTDYRATSDVTWSGWLRGDGELFHEYGHAWSMYYANMVQADPTLGAYLQARGLGEDARVGTAYPWMPGELIAEDYRQLFGTVSAQGDTQMNRDIPVAKDVPGLKSFLSGAFMQSRAG